MGYIDDQVMGFQNFGQGTPKQVAVGTTSTPLLMANPLRIYFEFINNTTSPVWISFEVPAVPFQGKRILCGGDFKPESALDLYLGQINAVTTNGTPVMLTVIEGE